MKVKCKSCGKKFDPDKTSSMCPKCGSWYVTPNHYDGADVSQDTIYDCDDCKNEMAGEASERSNSPAGNLHAENRNSTGRDDNVAGKKATIVSFIVIIAMIIVTMTVSLISSDNDNDYYVEDEGDDYSDGFSDDYNYLLEHVPVTKYVYGDEIEGYGIYGNSVIMKIDSVETAELPGADMPSGYDVYDVEYELYDAQSDEDYITNQFEVYLRTKTGEMLNPMDEVDVDYMMNDDSYSAINGINRIPEAKVGHLYFMVRRGDYEYMVVYSRHDIDLSDENIGYSKDAIENIGIVGDDADTNEWYDVSLNNAETDDVYSVEDGGYIQKVETGKDCTLPGGVNISAQDIRDCSFIDMDDKDDGDYDTYIVGIRLINHGALYSNIDAYDSGLTDDSGAIISPLRYGGSCEGSLAPMSMVNSYMIVSVEKGRTGKVQIVYQLNDVESGKNIKSVWIELPQ